MKEPLQTALDKFNLDDSAKIITNGSLQKIKPADAEKFDLIIVDEAHKFRNDGRELRPIPKALQNKTHQGYRMELSTGKKSS